MRSRWTFALVSAALSLSASQALADGTVVQRQLGTTAAPWGYLEYLPPGYDASPNEKYALVVSLSGIGELGNGTTQLGNVAVAGPIHLIEAGSTYFADKKVIAIQPQAPDQWMFDAQISAMQQFLPYLKQTYRVDRIYLTGLSSGGGGVYAFVGGGDAAGLITAAIAICGNEDPYDGLIDGFKTIPLWSFQNWGDTTNPRSRAIGFSTKIGQALSGNATLDVLTGYPNQSGDPNQAAATTETAVFDGSSFAWTSGTNTTGDATLRLTLYTGSSHDAWTETYANTAVWDWLFSQGAPTSMTTSSGAGGAGGAGGSTSSASPAGGHGATGSAGGSSASGGGNGGAHHGSGAGAGGSSGSGNADAANGADSGCAVATSAAPAGSPLVGIAVAFVFAAFSRRRRAPSATRCGSTPRP